MNLSVPPDPQSKTKKIGLLVCEDAPKWDGHESHWVNGLRTDASQWTFFRCDQGIFPTDEELASLDAFVITGSHYSVYEDLPWIRSLLDFIRHVLETHPRIKFLAGCFGHQACCLALGGAVGKNPSTKFVLGVEDLKLSRSLKEHPAFRKAASAVGLDADAIETAAVLQSHGDQVLSLPPGAIILAGES